MRNDRCIGYQKVPLSVEFLHMTLVPLMVGSERKLCHRDECSGVDCVSSKHFLHQRYIAEMEEGADSIDSLVMWQVLPLNEGGDLFAE